MTPGNCGWCRGPWWEGGAVGVFNKCYLLVKPQYCHIGGTWVTILGGTTAHLTKLLI